MATAVDFMAAARAQSDRFWSHARRVGDCLEWQAGRDKDGYGKFAISLPRKDGKQQQKHVRAHRLALLLSGVELQPGQLVLHSCDNPRCVNVAHLRAAHGEGHPAASAARDAAWDAAWSDHCDRLGALLIRWSDGQDILAGSVERLEYVVADAATMVAP